MSSAQQTLPPKKSSWATYKRLLRYLRPYRGRFALALLAMSLYGATDGAVPYILKRVLDDVFSSHNKSLLEQLVVTIVLFACVRGVFGFLERFLIASVGHRIVRDIRNSIHAHLLGMSPSFFSANSSGSLISRMTNDTLQVRTVLTDAAGAVLRDTVRVIALMTVAIYLDPVLGLIAFIGFPVALYPVMKFGKKVRRLSRQGQDRFGGLTSLLHEAVGGHRVVAAFGQEQAELDRFKAENDRLTDTFISAEKYGALSGPTNEMIASLGIAAVIVYGGLSVMNGVRTQGDFIAFITSVFLLYEPLKKLGRTNTAVQTGLAAAERIFEVLDRPSDIQNAPDAVDIVVERPLIAFEQVWFRYPQGEMALELAPTNEQPVEPAEEWAVRDVSLSIAPGSTLALVGMSGGGKSTLANLLPRFYDVTKGSITIDGVDIRRATLASLRRSISIVGQHTFLFNHSVRYNIAYGRPEAPLEEVMEAARAAHADQFIRRLPEGYDTIIGEQGFRLSGGERARIAIARALLKDSPILVLDEATASLDSESERLVQEAIDRLMENRTVLVIAHRLSTIRKARQIAVLSQGRLVEVGAHEELIARGGEYAKLHRLQFRDDPLERLVVGG